MPPHRKDETRAGGRDVCDEAIRRVQRALESARRDAPYKIVGLCRFNYVPLTAGPG